MSSRSRRRRIFVVPIHQETGMVRPITKLRGAKFDLGNNTYRWKPTNSSVTLPSLAVVDVLATGVLCHAPVAHFQRGIREGVS